jgi:anti-sigma factor RsiW
MTCREFVELVTDHVEGVLPDDQRLGVEEHVERCVWCSRYLDQMRVTIATLGVIPVESVPDEARTKLLAAFSDWRGA